MTERFEAEILEGRGGGAYVEIPFSVEERFGTRGRVKVHATFDGHPYRGSIAPMGGRHVLGVLKEIRAALGKQVGDRVVVELSRDTEPRTVDIPPELATALSGDAVVKARFEAMSHTHRREFAEWVGEAKKAETRLRRADKAVEMIRDGQSR